MKEKSIEELKKEIEMLKVRKEKDLLFTKTRQERDKLLNEIATLKRIEKKPSAFLKTFKSGLKTTGKGLGIVWRGVVKASQNIEKSTPGLPKTKQREISAISPEAQMFLPNIKKKSYMVKKKKPKVKTRVRTIKKQPRTKIVTRTVYKKPTKKQKFPWELD